MHFKEEIIEDKNFSIFHQILKEYNDNLLKEKTGRYEFEQIDENSDFENRFIYMKMRESDKVAAFDHELNYVDNIRFINKKRKNAINNKKYLDSSVNNVKNIFKERLKSSLKIVSQSKP